MRALIVDESIKSARTLKKGLEAEFYAVDIKLDVEEAINVARTGDYDVILIKKPTPCEFYCEIIKDLKSAHIKASILCLVDKDDVDERVDLLASGCDDILVKPYNFEELVARLRAILRRVGNFDNHVIRSGNLVIDLSAHDVKYKEKSIKLRSREFELLAYLMKNAGRVVTRNMVLENVWDMNADSFSNTVEVHITHLRRKLREGGKLIKTIRGVGYKLAVEKE